MNISLSKKEGRELVHARVITKTLNIYNHAEFASSSSKQIFT